MVEFGALNADQRRAFLASSGLPRLNIALFTHSPAELYSSTWLPNSVAAVPQCVCAQRGQSVVFRVWHCSLGTVLSSLLSQLIILSSSAQAGISTRIPRGKRKESRFLTVQCNRCLSVHASLPHTGATGGSGSDLKSLKVSVLVYETEKPNAPALLAMTLDAQLPKTQADLLAGAHGCLRTSSSALFLPLSCIGESFL